MPTDIDIANMALSHLGIGETVSDLSTDTTEEADAINAFLATVRGKMFEDFRWSFAVRTVALGLVGEDPTAEWAYSYRCPSDCKKIIRILSGDRNDSRQSRTPLVITSDVNGRLIYTDLADAQLEYVALITDESLYTDGFALAMSYLLAYHIGRRLLKGDPYGMRPQMMRDYKDTLAQAQANIANEEQPDEPPDSEFIRARL